MEFLPNDSCRATRAIAYENYALTRATRFRKVNRAYRQEEIGALGFSYYNIKSDTIHTKPILNTNRIRLVLSNSKLNNPFQ